MHRKLALLILALACCSFAAGVQAEKSTEIYIPIGQSPGLSGEYTLMGTIAGVNRASGTITMKSGSQRYTAIYLDRSKLNQSNGYGSMADCRQGMTAEVKYMGKQRQGEAEWIKLQIENRLQLSLVTPPSDHFSGEGFFLDLGLSLRKALVIFSFAFSTRGSLRCLKPSVT